MSIFKKLSAFLAITAKVCPSYIVLVVFKSIITCATTLFNVLFPKLLIDELMGAQNTKTLIFLGAAIVANNLILALCTNFYKRQEEIKSNYMTNTFELILSQKIMNLEYSHLEDPYYLDLRERAKFALTNQGLISGMVELVSMILTQLGTIIPLIVVLCSIGPVIIIVILTGVVIDLLIYKRLSKNMYWYQTNLLPINRRFGYYWDACTEKQNQKDIRLYGMQDILSERINEFNQEINKSFKKLNLEAGKSSGLMSIIGVLINAICYAYLGIRTVSDRFGKQIGVGSLTMYVSSAITLSSIIYKIGETITSLMRTLQFLDPYLEFMELKDETMEEGKDVFDGTVETVEFQNVSFAYPKSEKLILNNISFSIHRGQKISIVGLNGAGKSTLVKLICRMYKPTSGKILVNGKDIQDWDYNSYMKAISAVFQDYKIFNFTIAENISCQQKDSDMDEVNRLIKEVGLSQTVGNLPDGVLSLYGKSYDKNAVEFSGGEAQKIAIARSLYKKSSMVILDEPASALDPIAEAEIYEKFNSLVQDKTAIYISHRMSSSVFCDKILIIDQGKISDFDTHQNLMKKKDSLYYKLFTSQAENYRIEQETKDML